MGYPRLGLRVVILASTLALGAYSTARATDDSMLKQATDELKAAENAPNGERAKHLEAAKAFLDHLPPGYHKKSHRRAMKDIKSALFEVGQGDPNGNVVRLIQDAEDAVRASDE